MRYSNSIITEAYLDFLERFSVRRFLEVRLSFEDRRGETCNIDMKLMPDELEDMLAEQLEPVIGRSAGLDPEFADEIQELAEDIKDAMFDNESFEGQFGSVRVSSDSYEHPYFTTKRVYYSDGKPYSVSRSYTDITDDKEFVRVGLSNADGRFYGFACDGYEANAFLAMACHEALKRGISKDPDISRKVREALHNARTPEFTIQVSDITVAYKNTYIPPRPERKMSFYGDDWLAGRTEEAYGFLDDDDIKTLKASKNDRDRLDEAMEDMPDEYLPEPDDEDNPPSPSMR